MSVNARARWRRARSLMTAIEPTGGCAAGRDRVRCWTMTQAGTALEVKRSHGGAVQLTVDALQGFKSGLKGQLLRSGDPSYDEARKIWNGMIDRRPALIAQCAGTADVVHAIRFAREHGLLVSVRGGGHNIAGLAVCEGG